MFAVLLIFGVILEVLAILVPNSVAMLIDITSLLCALAGGVVGLVALLGRQERSVLVWLAMVPGLATIVFLIGEFLGRW